MKKVNNWTYNYLIASFWQKVGAGRNLSSLMKPQKILEIIQKAALISSFYPLACCVVRGLNNPFWMIFHKRPPSSSLSQLASLRTKAGSKTPWKIVFQTILTSTIYLLASLGLEAQSLQDYFGAAAENNPGLQAKYKEFEAALEKVPQVTVLQDPTLSFGYFISPVETRVGPQRARFSLSQMFPWFGTLKAQGDAAALLADARYQMFLEARNKLLFQVARAFYPLYELNLLQALEKENIDLLESYKEISTKQFENGNGSMADVLRVDIMLQDATTNLEILLSKEAALVAAFNALLNRPKNTEVILPDTLRLDSPTAEFTKDSLLVQNPALKELDLRLEASIASEKAAIKQGLPKVGIGLDYVIVDERTDLSTGQAGMDIADNGKDVLMPMLTVSLPIFRSKYKAAQKEARLMQESYALQKEEYMNALVARSEVELFEINRQRKLIELYEAQIQESKQILDLLFTAYSNTGQEFEEVLIMQQQLLKYEKMKAEAVAEYLISSAELNYIRGNK